jgi:hypothetical protein
MDLESAKHELFEAIGVLEPLGNAVLLRSQADDLNWFARKLARLPWAVRFSSLPNWRMRSSPMPRP